MRVKRKGESGYRNIHAAGIGVAKGQSAPTRRPILQLRGCLGSGMIPPATAKAQMKPRSLILGAGFGGLELSTSLSEAMGDTIDVTSIDKSDGLVFGFAKLDLLFGRATGAAIRHPHANLAKPGMRLLPEVAPAIDPVAMRVTPTRACTRRTFW